MKRYRSADRYKGHGQGSPYPLMTGVVRLQQLEMMRKLSVLFLVVVLTSAQNRHSLASPCSYLPPSAETKCTKQCPAGNTCKIQQVCVPEETCSSRRIPCPSPLRCEDSVSGPRCVPAERCDNKKVPCRAGYICRDTDTGPQCVPETCASKQQPCQPGYSCQDTNTGPKCIPDKPEPKIGPQPPDQVKCGGVTCEEGYICIKQIGGLTCTPDVPSCENIQCGAGFNCEVVEGHPNCVPNACGHRMCEDWQHCEKKSYGSVCVANA